MAAFSRLTLRSTAMAGALLLSSLAGGSAFAQQDVQGPAAPPVETVKQVIVYGDDPCPVSEGEAIVVCARKQEKDRFRIPEELRGDPNDPRNQSWAERAQSFEYVNRSGIQSCSPSGAGGSTGCFAQLVQQARAERAQAANGGWADLVAEARQERLGRIDEESEEVEARVKAEEARDAAQAAAQRDIDRADAAARAGQQQPGATGGQ